MEIFFATCPRGLELLLAEELQQFKAEKIHVVGGGVEFGGDFWLSYRINLESRIASRVLWQVATGRYRNEDDIYRAAYALPWTDWFDPARTIRVDVSATKSPLTSLNFVTLKIKDAVCDKVRRLSGRRPSVDTRQPDIPIQAHLTDRGFTLYLDTTGEPLFKRGHRMSTGEAPLRENLAAGILRLAGWVPGTPLLDPMCGSGTILLEAALHGPRYRAWSGAPFFLREIQKFRYAPLAGAVATKRRPAKTKDTAADLWQRSLRRRAESGPR